MIWKMAREEVLGIINHSELQQQTGWGYFKVALMVTQYVEHGF